MRAWVLAAGLAVAGPFSALAATRVTIPDLKDYPERYYGQTLLLECYYDKESPIWVRALPDADAWIGFFVTGKPDKTLTWSGEYYNLLFAPYSMHDAVRSLRGGDQITVVGEAFHYHSSGFDGAGIHIQQLLNGWGSTAKPIGQPAPSLTTQQPTRSEPPLSEPAGKFAVTINGKHYEGLRFGDPYNFDGVEFQVDAPQSQ